MPAEKNPAIGEAWAFIEKLSADDTARAIAEAMDKKRLDMASREAEAMESGKEIGKREQAVKIAKNLLLGKMSHAKVAETTDLSLDEVNRLAADL
ncbi:MAG: hypothetical protein LBF58_12935 [Deltaproteobacteria bacterium]|jgi:predicted transposase YdaD|nr:hypothetical protein [Deltaproteobacteria bacterium]